MMTHLTTSRFTKQWGLLSLTLTLSLFIASGCGSKGSGGAGDEEETDKTAENPPIEGAYPGVANSKTGTAKKGEWTDAQGRVWFGKVPKDVWYQNPTVVASQAGNVPVVDTQGTPTETNMGTETPVENEPPPATNVGAASGNWEKVISPEVIQDEVKRLQNELRQYVVALPAYRNAQKDGKVQMVSATIAALSGVASLHPAEIRWKDKAKHLRDISAKLNEISEAENQGKQQQNEAEVQFEKIGEILSGSVPADADPNSPDQKPFNDFAERGGLMRRMEAAQEWLKVSLPTERQFKEEAARVKLETEVLGALSLVITDLSYTSADEEEYAVEAKGMVADSQAMLKAMNDGNYQAFKTAMDRVQKRCNQCHAAYRFE